MLKEIMRIDDAGKLAFIESILSAEEIHYTVSDYDAVGAGIAFPARILVHKDDFDRGAELLIEAGLKHDIYPLKKPVDPNDN